MYVFKQPINLIDPTGLASACDTQLILEDAIARGTGPLGFLRVFLAHFPQGDFDFKANNSSEMYVVAGNQISASEFGNFLAGFSGELTGTRSGVRAAGIVLDFVEPLLNGLFRLDDPLGNVWDWDADSLPWIEAGEQFYRDLEPVCKCE